VHIYILYTLRDDDNNNNNETDIMFVQLMILLLLLLSCVCNSPADDRDGGGIFPRGSDQKNPSPLRWSPKLLIVRISGGAFHVCGTLAVNLRRSNMNII
jgi:hypothetical protein